MISLVLLGPPGAGKGTQAERLARDFGLTPISAGDILRAEVAAGTDLGKIAGPIIATGAMIPNDLMIEAIEKRISRPDCDQGVIFDGFPRTEDQAQALTVMLGKMYRTVSAVIVLQADEATLVARMNARVFNAVAKGQTPRSDDNIQTFKGRLDIYKTQSSLTIPYYPSHLVTTIDAMQSIDDVASDMKAAMIARGYKQRVFSFPPSAPSNPGAGPTPI